MELVDNEASYIDVRHTIHCVHVMNSKTTEGVFYVRERIEVNESEKILYFLDMFFHNVSHIHVTHCSMLVVVRCTVLWNINNKWNKWGGIVT